MASSPLRSAESEAMPTFLKNPPLAAVVAGLLALAACDRNSSNPRQTDRPKAKKKTEPPPALEPPAFDWRAALSAPKKKRAEVLGDPVGCEPADELAEPPPAENGLYLGEDAMCRYPDREPKSRDLYLVDGILFSAEVPVAVRLKPRRDLQIEPGVVDKLDLPNFAVVQRKLAGAPDDPRRVLSFRPESVPQGSAPPNPVAVDVVSTPDEPELVDAVLVYALTDAWPGVVDFVRLEGPTTVGKELLLPATMTDLSLLGNVFVQVGRDTFDLHRADDFPPRPDPSTSALAPISFPRADLAGSNNGEGWDTKLESFAEKLSETQPSGSKTTYAIAANHTVLAGELNELMMALDALTDATFQIVGRHVDSFESPFSPFARTNAINVDFRTGDEGLPEGGAAQIRTDDGFLPRRGRGKLLNLRVIAKPHGFDVIAGDSTIPPQDECPDPGPSVCLSKDIEIAEIVARAEKLQRDGEFEKSNAALQKALAAYDWEGLYATISDVAERVPESAYLFVETAPGLPVAIPVRVINLARWRRCDGTLCTDDDGRRGTMFDRPVWLAP